LLIGLGLFIVGFSVLDLVHVENLIYGIFGIILIVIVALMIGVLLIIWGIKNDVLEVIDYSLSLTKNIQQDTQAIVSGVVGQKIPLVGGFAGGLVRRVLAAATDNKLIFKLLYKADVFDAPVAVGEFANTTNRLRDFVEGIDQAVSRVLRVVQFPFMIVLLIAGLMLAGLVWMLN